MKIRDAIAYTDQLKPNSMSEEVKISLLSSLDGRIRIEVMGEAPEDIIAYARDDDKGVNRELLVPHPYDNIYLLYLSAMDDFFRLAFSDYASSVAVFNQAYNDFAKWWQRTYGR